jgi:(+)-trans-carveol dehydrogenase
MDRLKGKIAVITGAARGQGRSHAVRLAEDGADVIGIDFEGEMASVPYPMAKAGDLEETERLVAELDRRMFAGRADVRDFAALDEAVRRGVEEIGTPDILVVNAGIFSAAPFTELGPKQWSEMVDTNLTGVYNTVRATLPHMPDGSAIVMTSSTMGLQGFPNGSHYAAAKHGVVGLARSLAIELGPRGIRVNCVHPSTVETPMVINEAVYKLFRPDLEAPTEADLREASQSTHLLPVPFIEPRDVSNAVAFLASDEARMITGASLPVDAGQLTA